MTSIPVLWAFQAHAATRETRRRPHRQPDDPDLGYSSDEEDGEGPTAPGPRDITALAEQAEDRRWLRSTNVVARAGSTQHTAELQARQRIQQEARRAARAQHVPWRGTCAEEARLLRVLKGLPPLGSSSDADQLSDWEETLEMAKMERVRFGEREIVQIGRRRTLAEEELSHADDDLPRPSDVPMNAGPAAVPATILAPAAWDGDLDPDSTPWSDTSLTHTSIPVRVAGRIRMSMPGQGVGTPVNTVAALQYMGQQADEYMDADLDADLDGDDMDTTTY
ncbi:hypothetical protein ACI68E_004411 [Malassezia pachydermatis]|uniref:Uncharacterized protein n=1 Tax=Malassezia pachydermatis TaxID=77020 RepID=A0A0M9VNW3_9BASI|nr:hypothetical protein Malapachy_1807 [Malassezia pachydermatis]KOS13773.1 hypothetical protein Malapachy_1807 [Malassezia pachydermatis]